MERRGELFIPRVCVSPRHRVLTSGHYNIRLKTHNICGNKTFPVPLADGLERMESTESWRAMFENWPDSIPRAGLIVTTFQETIPFSDFMISGGLLLLDRDQPDSQGARKIILSYDVISAVKITSPMELARFQVMGFQPPL